LDKKKSPKAAKFGSILRIESALAGAREGLSFNELKRATGLHQDTLTIRLHELGKHISKRGRRYIITGDGCKDLDQRELLRLISAAAGLCVVGGAEGKGSSLDLAEDAILKSSSGYAFPAVSPAAVQGAMIVAHKYFMLHHLSHMIRNGKIDGKKLASGMLTPEFMTSIKKGMSRTLPTKLVLSFTIDRSELINHLREEYVRELLRVADVEDETHIESKGTRYLDSYRGV
jgi:hypothetical protein